MTSIARIEGYASIFNAADLNGDVVAPGAFAKALARRGADGVRMLYQHAVETPLGRWTHLREDARGLYAIGELILETERARDIAALIEGRALDGLSIGFQTVKAKKEREGRIILEADLWEISVVTFPMADGARIRRLSYATDADDLAATLKSAAEMFRQKGLPPRDVSLLQQAPSVRYAATSPASGGGKGAGGPSPACGGSGPERRRGLFHPPQKPSANRLTTSKE